MSTALTWQTVSTSSDATEQLGERLGQQLKGREIIELVSDLGGGKTTLVRGLARGMGSRDHVSSPTFKISNIYKGYCQNPEVLRLDAGQGAGERRTEPYMKYGEGVSEPATQTSAKNAAGATGSASRQSSMAQELWLHHFDFYRLNDPGVVAHELHDVLEDPRAVVVVEWGDVVQHVLPPRRLTIKLATNNEHARQISIGYPASLKYVVEKL